ncbi:MAG: methyltransferase domain-containing protein [Burkholderiales bacterium]|nr:methyltransferase domain-containing protein [Burkholderiales bacterium]
MTIAAHSQIAAYYQFRPPYAPRFFRDAAAKLGATPDSVLLDLCCGRGELAAGFAASCKAVFAVDGSAEMLEHRIAKPNVTFLQHDVNAEDLALPQAADHFVIGSAIHWIEPASLAGHIERQLKPGGKVLVTHTLLNLEGRPYAAALARLNGRFGSKGQGRSFEELRGAARLRACGFESCDGVRVVRTAQFDTDYLFRSQMSYLYSDFYEQVMADVQAYRDQLAEAVSPFLDAEGKLSAQLVNWGVIYSAFR